jgi:hypothetical protein
MPIQWENGWGGLGGYERIFWNPMHGFQAKNKKKSVRIRPIRPIRSPIVSLFSKAETVVIVSRPRFYKIADFIRCAQSKLYYYLQAFTWFFQPVKTR